MPTEATKNDRTKAVDIAVGQIEKQFGKGSIMRLGQGSVCSRSVHFDSAQISIDYALGIGGVPRGRVVEIYGPGSVGQDHPRPASDRAGTAR